MLLFRKLITITCFIALAYVKRFLNGHSRTLPRWNINIIQWINEFNPTNLLWLIARNESEETYLQASVLPLHFLSSVLLLFPLRNSQSSFQIEWKLNFHEFLRLINNFLIDLIHLPEPKILANIYQKDTEINCANFWKFKTLNIRFVSRNLLNSI